MGLLYDKTKYIEEKKYQENSLSTEILLNAY